MKKLKSYLFHIHIPIWQHGSCFHLAMATKPPPISSNLGASSRNAAAWHQLELNIKDWVKSKKNKISIISWKNHPPPGFEPRTSHSKVCHFTICGISTLIMFYLLNPPKTVFFLQPAFLYLNKKIFILK